MNIFSNNTCKRQTETKIVPFQKFPPRGRDGFNYICVENTKQTKRPNLIGPLYENRKRVLIKNAPLSTVPFNFDE
jgi:hypothetical protein